jgi:integral membrane protein
VITLTPASAGGGEDVGAAGIQSAPVMSSPVDPATIAPPRPPLDRRLLNAVLAVGIADGVLLLVLLFFAFVSRSDSAVQLLGPVHGIGFLILVGMTAKGAVERRWGWWFPAIVVVTAGPIGSIAGDVILRRGDAAAAAASTAPRGA